MRRCIWLLVVVVVSCVPIYPIEEGNEVIEVVAPSQCETFEFIVENRLPDRYNDILLECKVSTLPYPVKRIHIELLQSHTQPRSLLDVEKGYGKADRYFIQVEYMDRNHLADRLIVSLEPIVSYELIKNGFMYGIVVVGIILSTVYHQERILRALLGYPTVNIIHSE